MTFAILIGAAILLSAGYMLRKQGLDTLELRAGRIRLVRGHAPTAKKTAAATEKESNSLGSRI